MQHHSKQRLYCDWQQLYFLVSSNSKQKLTHMINTVSCQFISLFSFLPPHRIGTMVLIPVLLIRLKNIAGFKKEQWNSLHGLGNYHTNLSPFLQLLFATGGTWEHPNLINEAPSTVRLATGLTPRAASLYLILTVTESAWLNIQTSEQKHPWKKKKHEEEAVLF